MVKYARKEAAAKASMERLATDKAAAEKAAVDKAAAAKAATASAAPSIQKAGPQSWEYLTYNARGPSVRGYISIEDKGGKTIFRMVAGYTDICYSGELDATVVRTEIATVITALRDLRGCEPVRYVIWNDGTGGQRHIKKGSSWVSDGLDHGLTPRK